MSRSYSAEPTSLILHPTVQVLAFAMRPELPDRYTAPHYTATWSPPSILAEIATSSRDTALLCALRALGVAEAEIAYSGYGDSGDVESIHLRDANGQDLDCTSRRIELSHLSVSTATWSIVARGFPVGANPSDARVRFRAGRYGDRPKPKDADAVRALSLGLLDEAVFDLCLYSHRLEPTCRTDTVSGFLHDVVLDLLGRSHGGWEINEGSQGDLTIDIATGEMHLEHGMNITTTETVTDTWDAPTPEQVVALDDWRCSTGRA
ncbi:MAG: DUF6878 family protein [Litorimonas sp.]